MLDFLIRRSRIAGIDQYKNIVRGHAGPDIAKSTDLGHGLAENKGII